ncbi:hypothetical protein SAMN05216224_10828 [Thioclava dalianensis]|uniref:hypothetical protein n=1 Tax=Thioclava dalianensis TaxID=1185766 RepID=UPI0008F64BA7|nr:hypothetical protein [Thioclava dalianensis]SFN61975.1 hypothetical protein SAMN05216224_10828 [Thioclava dalianensis]
MIHARAFATLTASVAALWLAAHCIAKARAEITFTQAGGYSEIAASLHHSGE